jgi:hypothetical protein
MDWWTLDAGGRIAASGLYTLGLTLGQPDTGYSAAGDYAVTWGYWSGQPVSVITGAGVTLHTITYGQMVEALAWSVLFTVLALHISYTLVERWTIQSREP